MGIIVNYLKLFKIDFKGMPLSVKIALAYIILVYGYIFIYELNIFNLCG